MTLTPRESEVAAALRDYRHQTGLSPTYRELARIVGVSHGRLAELLWQLAQKRVVGIDKSKARSLTILRPDLLPPMERTTRIAFRGEVA